MYGITVTDAYIRIDRLIAEHLLSLTVAVTVYADAAHAVARDGFPTQRTYTFPWPNPITANFVAYLYAQMMLLPEFAGGVMI